MSLRDIRLFLVHLLYGTEAAISPPLTPPSPAGSGVPPGSERRFSPRSDLSVYLASGSCW